MPCITAGTASGDSSMIDLPRSATLGDLRQRITVALDIQTPFFQLAVGASLLPLDESMVLDVAGVEDGTHVAVILGQRPLLPVLSPLFTVRLESSRRRLGFQRFSSAFTILYKLHVDLEKSCIKISLVRKNDTDHVEIDGQTGSCKGESGHWMTGSKPFQDQAFDHFELADILHDWMDRSVVISDVDKQYWSMPSDVTSPSSEGRDRSGWFVAPTSDCFELDVTAAFPASGNKGSHLHIARILVDASGNPVRAALYHAVNCSPADHLEKADPHEMASEGLSCLEEFDVTLAVGEA